MKLLDYIEKQENTIQKAAEELGFTYEDVRRYCKGIVIPRPDKMKKIIEWSNGEVTANDFYAVDCHA